MSGTAGFIDFHIVGDAHGVQAMLSRLDSALSPVGLTLFMTGHVAPMVRERAAQRFAGEGDDVSGKWAPLLPATQEIRSRGEWPVGPTSPINKRTGELEDYITKSDAQVVAHSLGATMTYPKPTTRKSISQKMKTAQQGRSIPRTVPRPVLGLNERDLSAVLLGLAFHVRGHKVP